MPAPAVMRFNLAGPDHGVHAGAVAVLHLAAEKPTDGLQSGMRMWRHVHAGAAPDVMGAVMVGEAPRPDQRPLPLRQRPPHPDGPGPPNGTSRDAALRRMPKPRRQLQPVRCRCCSPTHSSAETVARVVNRSWRSGSR